MGKAKEEAAPEERIYVYYAGRPTTLRLISAEEWSAAGVKDHPDTLWGPSNDWEISKEDLGLNEEQYARIILADHNLHEVRRPVSSEE
jgi:hypothetical protein